jgi:hypothetical protein
MPNLLKHSRRAKKSFVFSLAFVNILYLSALGTLLAPAGTGQASSPDKGRIEIFKEARALSDQSFDFFSDLGDFSLKSGQRMVFDELDPGQYSFGEIVPAGWELREIECAGDFYPNSTIDLSSRQVTLGLDAGEKLLCKFINYPVDEEEEKGSITVRKYLDADGLASTTGDRWLASTTDWTFSLGDGSATSSQATVGGMAVFSDLTAGVYAVSEIIPSGYQLMEPAGNQYQVNLAEGEQTTISFVNHRPQDDEPATSSIKVIKYIDQDGLASTTDDRVLAADQAWAFLLFDGSATTSQNTVMGSTTFAGLAPGAYHLSEQIPAGFAVLEPASNHLTVTVGAGEAETAVFVNYRLSAPDTGSITVRKFRDLDGLASTTADRSLVDSVWTFGLGNGLATTSRQTAGGQAVFAGLDPGDYVITETVLSGWTAVDPAGGIASATLAAGEDIVVDFANFLIPSTPPPSGNGGGGGGGGGGFLPGPSVQNGQSRERGL